MEEMNVKKGITGNSLKCIACLTMLIDHIGAVILSGDVSSGIYILSRLVGRIAFPIFCFLLIEGFRHTSDINRYIGRMLLFAFISEIPFDLAVNGCLIEWGTQNIYFTLTLGLITLAALDSIRKRWSSAPRILISLAVISASALFNGFVLKGDYGAWGIVAIALMFFTCEKNNLIGYIIGCLILAAMESTEMFAIIALPLIALYNGERGGERGSKYLFYAFYPAHLLILELIKLMPI